MTLLTVYLVTAGAAQNQFGINKPLIYKYRITNKLHSHVQCRVGGSPFEETLLDLSIQKLQICLSYVGLHAMDQPRHTDKGVCGHARWGGHIHDIDFKCRTYVC